MNAQVVTIKQKGHWVIDNPFGRRDKWDERGKEQSREGNGVDILPKARTGEERGTHSLEKLTSLAAY